MNTNQDSNVESTAEDMSYALRKYNFIQTRIKNMTNLVNLRLIVNCGETAGDSTKDGWRVSAESPEDYVFPMALTAKYDIRNINFM